MEKLQLGLTEVTYPGHTLSKSGTFIGTDRIQVILDLPKPVGKKKHWVLYYAELSQPLHDLAHGHNLSANDKVTWTETAEISFQK